MPLHGLLMKKAFDTRIPLPRIHHFERKREIFFVRGKAKDVRGTASEKHRTPCAPPKTVFHADRSTQEKERGKRKRSLGCARDDDTRIPLPARFSSRCDANLRPFGAPPSMGRRENAASQTPHEKDLRYEYAAPPYRHFEHGAVKPPRRIAPSPVSSFRAKARNLFRSRSRKDVRGAGNGKPSAPCAPKKRCFMQAVSCRKMKEKSISNRR